MGDERDRLEQLESVTAIVRNLTYAAVVIAAAWVLGPKVSTFLVSDDSRITELDLGIIKLAVSNQVNTAARLEGVEDTAAAEAVTEVATLLETGGSEWSFLGTFRDDVFISRYFEGTTYPEIGDVLQASTDVYRRADKPQFTILGWRMGEIVGVVKEGSAVRVDEIVGIPAKGGGQRVWVRGTLVQEPPGS